MAVAMIVVPQVWTAKGLAQPAPLVSSRLMLGDAAVEIRPADDGRLTFAIADSVRSLILTVLARDARQWADSASRILRPIPRSRRSRPDRTVVLEEPGLESGSMSLTRRDTDAGTRWSLFVADRAFEEIRVSLEVTDVRALVAAMRQRADAALPPARRSRPRPPAHTRP